jgi:deoxyribonuclease-4
MAAHSLLFGTAGIPHSAPRNSSISGIESLREKGLDAMELEFVQRVSMGEQMAGRVRQAAAQHRVRLSVHAPYYINLNSKDPEKLQAGTERLLRAARVAASCGARNLVFHPGFYHQDPPEQVYERIAKILRGIAQQLRAEELNVCLRPETAGRVAQFGNLREILQLCVDIEGILPCIDFAHLHARSSGELGSSAGWRTILEKVRATLGRRGLVDAHLHVQGIAYNGRGERRHQNLAESDLNYRELLQALWDYEVAGTLICESPNLEEDALLLQSEYRSLAMTAGAHQTGG